MGKRFKSPATEVQADRPAWPGAERVRQPVIMAHRHLAGAMLPMLHALQAEFGYVPPEVESMLAEALNLSRAEVFGVISFYHDFRREPAGRHVLRICRAEACQAMGAVPLADRLLGRLGLQWGGRTPDGCADRRTDFLPRPLCLRSRRYCMTVSRSPGWMARCWTRLVAEARA